MVLLLFVVVYPLGLQVVGAHNQPTPAVVGIYLVLYLPGHPPAVLCTGVAMDNLGDHA